MGTPSLADYVGALSSNLGYWASIHHRFTGEANPEDVPPLSPLTTVDTKK